MEIADLPADEDSEGIARFALSFNGYEYHGSFEACAEAAMRRRRDTVESVRNELFFESRAAVHQGSERAHAGVLDLYRELRPILVELLSRPARDRP